MVDHSAIGDEERTALQAMLTAKGTPRRRVTAADLAKKLNRTTEAAEHLLRDLAARRLVTPAPKGGKSAYTLAAEIAASLKPDKPVRARATKPPPATLSDLQALETRLMARLDAIERLLGAAPRSAGDGARKDVASAIPAAIREANAAGRHTGLVPIPEVRRLVVARTGATRAQFDEALLALERSFAVDLKIADDPRRADAAEGIHVPGRGLVYYALAR